MRFHMVQLHPFGVQESFEGANLVDGDCREFLGAEFHLAPAKALEVREAGMGADENVAGFAGADGGGHYQGVAGVEAACDVGDVD